MTEQVDRGLFAVAGRFYRTNHCCSHDHDDDAAQRQINNIFNRYKFFQLIFISPPLSVPGGKNHVMAQKSQSKTGALRDAPSHAHHGLLVLREDWDQEGASARRVAAPAFGQATDERRNQPILADFSGSRTRRWPGDERNRVYDPLLQGNHRSRLRLYRLAAQQSGNAAISRYMHRQTFNAGCRKTGAQRQPQQHQPNIMENSRFIQWIAEYPTGPFAESVWSLIFNFYSLKELKRSKTRHDPRVVL